MDKISNGIFFIKKEEKMEAHTHIAKETTRQSEKYNFEQIYLIKYLMIVMKERTVNASRWDMEANKIRIKNRQNDDEEKQN